MTFTTIRKVTELRYSTNCKLNFMLFALFFFVQFGLITILQLDSLQDVMEFHWQFTDFDLLQDHPFETIFLDHAQPPLLSLLVYVFLQFPLNLYHTFIIFNALCMSIVCLVIFKILSREVNQLIAVMFSFAYCVFPSVLLNVSYPFYTCVSAFGYSMIVFGFWKTFHSERSGVLFFSLGLTIVNNTRTSFTFIHVFILIGAFILLHFKLVRKSNLTSFVLALTFVFSLLVPTKNLILYDFFGSSSWVYQTVASGWKLNAPLGYFPTPEKIKANFPDLKCKQFHSKLDLEETKNNGQPNFHSCLVLEYSKILASQKGAGYSIGNHLRSMYGYTLEYLSLPDTYMFLTNRDRIWFYSELMKVPQLSITIQPFKFGGTYSPRIILPLVVFLILLSLFRRFSAFDMFSLILLSLHFLTYTFSEGIESRRHVFEVEFLYVVLLPYLVRKLRESGALNLKETSWLKPTT